MNKTVDDVLSEILMQYTEIPTRLQFPEPTSIEFQGKTLYINDKCIWPTKKSAERAFRYWLYYSIDSIFHVWHSTLGQYQWTNPLNGQIITNMECQELIQVLRKRVIQMVTFKKL